MGSDYGKLSNLRQFAIGLRWVVSIRVRWSGAHDAIELQRWIFAVL